MIPLLLNIIFLGIVLCYLIFFWKIYPFSIGGSIIFIGLIGISNYFSSVYKQFMSELSLLSLILVSLMGINFLAYIEYKNGLSEIIVIGVCILIFIMHITILYLINNPIRQIEQQNSQTVATELRRKISRTLSESGFFIVFIICTASYFMSRDKEELLLIKDHLLFTTTCLVCLLSGLIYSIILANKRKELFYYVPYLITKKQKLNFAPIKKWFFHFVLGIFVFGLILEWQRGLWFLWLYSCLTIIVVITIGWKTWKFVFQDSSYNINNVEIKEIENMPYTYDPKYVWKRGLLFSILGFIYLIFLVAYSFSFYPQQFIIR